MMIGKDSFYSGVQRGPVEKRRKVQDVQGPSTHRTGGEPQKGPHQPFSSGVGPTPDLDDPGPKRKREGITAMAPGDNVSPGGSTRY